MAAFTKLQKFVEAVAHGKHNLSTAQIKVALTNVLPVAASAGVLADITEIAYTYCSNRNVATSASAQTGGIYKLTCADLTITATGGPVGPFRYVSIYNDSATAKDLIGFYDRGDSITLLDGEKIDLDLDQAGGVLTLG